MKRCIFPILIALLAMTVGSCNFSKPDYSTLSKSELRKLDEQGDAQASLQLGRMAIKDMDRSSAKKYFTKAADQNIPEGLHNLALINLVEHELFKNVADSIEAINNLQKAVDTDFIPSKGLLAFMIFGSHQTNRRVEATRLAEEAANEGHKLGYFALALDQIQSQGLHIVQGDRADELMDKAISAGSGYALVLKVNQYLNGRNSQDDICAEIEKYRDQYPMLLERLNRVVKGDNQAMQDNYFTERYFLIEDWME